MFKMDAGESQGFFTMCIHSGHISKGTKCNFCHNSA